MERYLRSFNQSYSNYGLLNYAVNDYEVKLVFKRIVAGRFFKFEFTNEFDNQNLKVISAKANIMDDENSAVPITFNNEKSFEIPAFSNLWSDSIELEVVSRSPIIYVFLKMENEGNYLKSAANLFEDDRVEIISQPPFSHEFLPSNVQLLVGIRSIATYLSGTFKSFTFFGDSLTNHAYFANPFICYLTEQNINAIGLNAGISGNKLLSSGEDSISKWKYGFGRAGIRRFDKDVLLNQSDYVVALIGLNDLFHPGTNEPMEKLPSSQQLIEGIKQLMEKARSHNTKYIPVTLPPFKGARNHEVDAWTKEKEKIRQDINAWIRKQVAYLDLDQIVALPDKPEYLNVLYDEGDHIHFSKHAGREIGVKLAEQFIDLI